MADFDVGVSVSASCIVKRIDSDYFEEGDVGLEAWDPLDDTR
jgi:restriction system protein